MTLYHHTSTINEDGAERHVFAPASAALELTGYERRIIAGQLAQKLAEFHEKVTGPRDRIGSDLTHNTLDAARGFWQTLIDIDPTVADKFKATYGTPSSWTYGPVVDSQGWLCAGIYHERVLDEGREPVSPSRYVTPSLRGADWAQGTERDRRLDEARKLRRQADLLDPAEAPF
jgi:hypothetical protein